MPEGDVIYRAADRIRAALEGRAPRRIVAPQRRHAADRWPERLADRVLERVESRGKHLLLFFAGDLVIHSHLGMVGSWAVRRLGDRWPRAPRRAWLLLETDTHAIVEFDGPLLELMTAARARSDPRLAMLGPDVLGSSWNDRRFLGRLREDDPTRPVGEALLDQRNVAGIGNFWKAEALFSAGVDPWRPAGRVADGEALAVVHAAREQMMSSARGVQKERKIYGRRGEPCPRCGAPIRARGQGDENRITYWCSACQH